MMRRFKSFICRSTWTFSPKIVMSFIFSVLLVSTIFYLKTVFFPDFTFLQVAHCVNFNDMAPISFETHMFQDNKVGQMSNSSVMISQENLNNQPSIPRVLSGCSNREAARWMGSIAGFSLGLASSIWLYISSGIDFSSYACDLIDLMKSASDSSVNR